jgi:hypothetical protein
MLKYTCTQVRRWNFHLERVFENNAIPSIVNHNEVLKKKQLSRGPRSRLGTSVDIKIPFFFLFFLPWLILKNNIKNPQVVAEAHKGVFSFYFIIESNKYPRRIVARLRFIVFTRAASCIKHLNPPATQSKNENPALHVGQRLVIAFFTQH